MVQVNLELSISWKRISFPRIEEVHVSNKIAKTEPQAAYTCFLSVYRHKFNYYMKTVPDICQLLGKVNKVILSRFIPAIMGGIIITENERKLLYLAPRLGGLGIPILEKLRKKEYQNYIMISEYLCNHITDWFRGHDPEKWSEKDSQNHKKWNELRRKKTKWSKSQNWCVFLAYISKKEGYIVNKQMIWSLSNMAGDWNKFLVIVYMAIHFIYNTLSNTQKESS